ncbi:MAG TPA: TetR/AcrR family transcriptional regulator [Terriglobia bacterium]|nr:TetR/AcrR family transcriptional regulator [Terriglobia bacterium]
MSRKLPAVHQDLRLERGARARSEILRAAAQSFATHGLEGARTEAIAGAAKVNKALLFYHFKTKNALFSAVVEHAIGDVHRSLSDLLSSPAPPQQIMVQYLNRFFEAISSSPDLGCLIHRAVLSDSKLAERLAQKYFIPRFRKLVALIERGVREGDFRRVDAFQTAISLNALVIFSLSGIHAVKNIDGISLLSKEHLGRRKAAVLDFVRHGLFRDPEANS